MFKNLIELTKVRIGFLVLTTTIIGFYLGSQGKIDNTLLFFTVIGTLFSSTGSSVMNNVIESESDKMMKRTKNRVLPTEKISLNFAKFNDIFSVGSTLFFVLFIILSDSDSITLFITEDPVEENNVPITVKKSNVLSILP